MNETTDTRHKMSSAGLEISFINKNNTNDNKTDEKLDLVKIQKFEDDINKSLRVSCRENFNEYLYNSTLHGLRYVGDRTITRVERAFFAIMFFLVMLLSIYFISNVWIKWTQSPIIITLSSKSTSIKDIPFPAVTVCNMNQVRKSAIQKIPKDSLEYSVAMGLCRMGRATLQNETTSSTNEWELYQKMLLTVSPSCEDMLLQCEFGGNKFDCSKFIPILTDDGMCCVWNGVPRKYLFKRDALTGFEDTDDNASLQALQANTNIWSAEKGYPAEGDQRYPQPGVGSGNELGLTVVLKADIHDYFCTSTRSYGFKILLHNPTNLPKVSNYGIAIPTHYETRLAVSPTFSIASKAIKKIDVSIRQCIFQSENFLSFYNTYSDTNCLSECETKAVYKHCGCVMYYQPQPHANISICGTANMQCIIKVDQEIQIKQNPSYKCDYCLTGCYALNYDYSFSTAKIFDRVPFLTRKKLDPKDVSIVHIYYPRSTFRAQQKEELVGFTDFLSNIGGLLGLFMGFSVISLIEMCYFISIRPYCDYIRFLKKRKELIMRIVRKVRQKKHQSPIIIRTVQTDSDFNDEYYRQRYLN